MIKIINLIKGVVIGVAMLVPGVSGGTMAIILGLYDDMIRSVGSFFEDIKSNAVFLGTLALGGIIGVLAFSRLIEYSLEMFKFPTIYLFLGIILGGIPVLYNKVCKGASRKSDILYFISGFLIILIMSLNTGTIINLAASDGIVRTLFLFVAGIIIAIALILPGISSSFMLLVIGLYDITLKAINNVEFNYLIPIMLGAGFGVIATTKIIENWLNNKPRPTYMLILGFVLGSVVEVFPGIPVGYEALFSVITFVLGFIAIRYITIKYSVLD